MTTSTVLTTDLVCHGDGLVIAAEGVTLDLGGHTLTGDGRGTGVRTDNRASFIAATTVRNGTVTGFARGIALGLTTHGGLPVQGSVQRMRLAANGVGLDTTATYGAVSLADSTITGQATYGVDASVTKLTVTRTTLATNRVGLRTSTHGVVTVTDSVFRANQAEGLRCWDGNATVTRTVFAGNPTGLWSSFCGTTLTQDLFTGGDLALRVDDPAYGVTVRQTTVAGAGLGMRVKGDLFRSVVVDGNAFLLNRAAGLQVLAAKASSTVQVTGNVFTGNGRQPGTWLDPPVTPLTAGLWADGGALARNTASFNAGLGIHATGAAVDGGDNRAFRNGDRRQCVGVICR